VKKIGSYSSSRYIKTIKYIYVLLAIITVFLCSCSKSNTKQTTVYQEIANYNEIANKKINAAIIKHNTPGLSIIMTSNYKTIYNGDFGYTCNNKDDLINNNTIFEAGSLSKPVFAYGVLLLVKQGLLELDEPLSKYVDYPVINNTSNIITAGMILSHTSGLPNWRSEPNKLKVYFKPGERFSYSGEGFMYLQKVVEKITNQPLEAYMQENVFEPLGMLNSSFARQANKEDACGHNKEGGNVNSNLIWKQLKGLGINRVNAAASLTTTAQDYARFLNTISNMIDARSDNIFTQQSKVSKDGPVCIDECSDEFEKNISWGLGVGLMKVGKDILFWHWGDDPGFKNYFISTKKGDAVIIFTNSDNGMRAIIDIVSDLKGSIYVKPLVEWLKYIEN